ncbi:PorT family protein [Hymenobacter gummosus]|uniref:PorT family protein n=1 Tax=Hymenobacter gummosus TaxID=1776032 RepID=A0A431U8U6_9BACT|nr:porin family protein [Hymenobacter gummosus]RTQ53438.1 PorT family protein [Hymenobacter gummosus]
MKKTFLALLLCAATGSTFAQGIKLGLKIGPTLSTISGKDSDMANPSLLLGPHGGITANFGLTDMLSFQPELLYSQKGYRYDFTTTKGDVVHHYIDVPLLLRIDADGPFFELGPQVGFLLKAVQKPDQSTDFERTDDYNTTDIGYVAGVGYQLSSGPSIGLRYNGGITRLYKEGEQNRNIRNSAFMLQLGYRFGGE